jgi:hypothetical protein
MSAPVGISSLLAIAIVRRLLLELKVPEGQDPARMLAEPIEVWVSRPVEDFNGQSPAQVLAAPGGDDMVRSWLQRRLR